MDSWFEEDEEVTRHYLPKTDVRLDLLSPTSKVTGCPYKGTAQAGSQLTAKRAEEQIVAWPRSLTKHILTKFTRLPY